MIILGAGLSGLIAGNMLRRFKPIIYEAQAELPNNHAALLRFRSDAVSNACAVPFKKVRVHKAVCLNEQLNCQANIQMMNYYSKKVTGEYAQRSLENLQPSERYIAPPDFIAQAAQQLNIKYSSAINGSDLMQEPTANPVISTVPMDTMMEMMSWSKKPEFKYQKIWSITVDIKSPPCDLYQTIYYPGSSDSEYWIYRASITGSKMIIECSLDPAGNIGNIVACVKGNFGIAHYDVTSAPVIKEQKYGKLLPIDDRLRKEFILWLTKEHNIYSLGRFATWRQILLDDVVKDVNVIESLMHGSGYENNKHTWKVA